MKPEPAPGHRCDLERVRDRGGIHRFLIVGALVVVGGAEIVISWYVAHRSLLGARWYLIIVIAIWAALWVLGAQITSRAQPRRLVLIVVVLLAVGLRVAAATGTTPSISADLYRYGWDAHVQLSGIDPYRYPPDSAAVARLREAPWFPDPAGCQHIGKPPGCTTIDRADVRTIYPPVAEAWFDVVHFAWPGPEGARPWQVAGGLVDDTVVGLLALILIRTGRDARVVGWYALCPLPVVEFAGNGHVDYLALLFLLAAALALGQDRRGLAGALIGLATMVKLYPAIALAAALRRGRWRMLAAFAATVVLAELPHLLVVGTDLIGYLPGYLQEEHYATGSRYLLIGMLPLPSTAATVLAAGILIAVLVAVIRSKTEHVVGLCFLFTAALLVACPVQPWYAVAVGALGVLIEIPVLFLPALLAEPYYAAVILDSSHQVAIGRACYGLAALGILTTVFLRHHTRAGRPPHTVDQILT